MNNTKQIRILLIDDDAELLASAKKILKLQGNYEVDPATSTDMALEHMSHKNYDVLVCDIQMPVTNGFEFLKELRKSGNDVPFIVFTVTDNKETALESFRLGANGFVGKYGNPTIVYSTLGKCIDEAVKNRAKNSK